MLSTTTIDRVTIEQTILGMCLVEQSGYPKIADVLAPVNFSTQNFEKGVFYSHIELYSAFEKLYPTKPINILSVASVLGRESANYIMRIAANVASASDIRYHAFQLLEFSIRQTFLTLLTKLSEGRTDVTAVAIHEIIDESLDYDNDILEIIPTAIAYLQRIESNAAQEVMDFHSKIELKVSNIKRLASIDALIKNLTILNLRTNDQNAQMAITHLSDLIKTILSKGNITNNELSKILNTAL